MTKGSIYQDRYYDPSGSFSVEIPRPPSGCFIDETFFDSLYRELTHFEIVFIPPEIEQKIVDQPEMIAPLLKKTFEKSIAALIKKEYPEASIDHEEAIQLDEIGQAYFAILSIPDELPSKKTNAGDIQKKEIKTKGPFSRRGWLVSFAQDHLVVISEQELVYDNLDSHDSDHAKKLNDLMLKALTFHRKNYINERPSILPSKEQGPMSST
jgi:hypothetical protein